ncbi:MAG: rhodanese-like domain-containing protein [Anaerolineaceae bacterium]|nr:rhodanese-like domain-containing protein [Anaerolineaceae bacterium]
MTKSKNSTKKSDLKKKGLPSWLLWVLLVIAVAAGGYFAIQQNNKRAEIVNTLPSEMSVAEVAMLNADDYYFLDVREPDEWNEFHIDWATLIPLGELEKRASELPKDKNIIVVCRSGNRSAQGRDILLKAGFESVTSMAGGMNEWRSQGNPVVTGP